MIQWKKSDIIKLGRAVSSFNKSVSNLSSDVISPSIRSFEDLKNRITTRYEFNRVLSSLKRFQDPSWQKVITLESGIKVTKWEFTEAIKARERATTRLNEELKTLTQTLGTGNIRINEINATLESFSKLEKSSAEDYSRRVASILRQGTTDYEYRKALIFQKNFIEAYGEMGRWEIVRVAQKYKDPRKFWNFIKNSEFVDIEMRYDVEDGTIEVGKMSKDESYAFELNKLLNK